MKCQKCDSPNADNAKFCSSCGAPLQTEGPPAVPTCGDCGAPIKENAKFCQSCGASVDSRAASSSSDEDFFEEENQPRRDMRYVILPLIFVPILVGIFYLLSFRSQNPESQGAGNAAGPPADMAQMMPIFQTIDSLKSVLESSPDDTTALLVLGEMFEVAGKFEDARKYYSRFLEIDPERNDVKLRVLGTLISEHKHEAEEELLNEILQIQGSNPHTLMHIGDMYDRVGKADKARDFYNRSLQAKPEQVDVFMRLAGLLFNEKEYTKAQEMLQKVLDKQPNNPHALYNMALALHLQGDHTKAVELWKKTVQVDANGDIGRLAQQALDSFDQIKGSN